MAYRIDMERVVAAIRDSGAKRVLVQLPDGLKDQALRLQQELSAQVSAELLFWAGSSFGACDLPVGVDRLGVDLILHLGHSEWVY